MDYHNTNYNQQDEKNQLQPSRPPKSTASSGMATVSLILGILSLVTLCFIPVTLVFGSLSIIFALLSRGGEANLSGNSKAGIVLSIVGIFLSFVFTILVIIASFRMYSSSDMQEMIEEYQYYYDEYYDDSDYFEGFDNFF